MFERAKIPQARPPVVKDFFAAFERAPDIPGQKFLQNDAADTVVEQPIVAAVHGTYTTEEAGVVDQNHDARQDDQNGRQQKTPYSEPNEHPYNGKHCYSCQRTSGDVLNAHRPRRRETHGQRVRLDRDPKNPPAGVGGLNGAAALTGPQCKMFARAFPHHLATPAQLAADIGRRQANHFVPRHGEMPAREPHPEASVAIRAMDIGRGGVPVVAVLIGEAEPQPNRIGEIELGHRTR
jgi:hypothetical protein